MVTLLIVESPSKAKKISKFLGKDYNVQASVGHVVDLSSGGKSSMGVNIDNDFTPRYTVIPDKRDKVKALIKFASSCDKIYLATDPDREGESIAWHLYNLLEKTQKPIKRVSFNEITKKAVLKAVQNPRDLDENLFKAQQARRVLDRIVGFSVSPYLINKFGSNLSAGRVQSVAVKLVVDRDKEIEKFNPEEYWSIIADLSYKNKAFQAKYTEKVVDKDTAQKIKSDLESGSFEVVSVKKNDQNKPPPPPLITSSLVSAAAGKYKFIAARTMKSAQELYEAGLITYMRTDSTRLSEDSVQECRDWLKENNYDLPEKGNFYGPKNGSQDAHEAIRPTNVKATPKNIYFSEDSIKIYTLIWERFVASQMNPAIYSNVSVIINNNNYKLKANGRALKYKGWLEVLQEKDKDILLPNLSEGDKPDLIKINADQKFTKPPSRYTEKTLVEELEKKGIGRPSTYASIMSKITNRNYVTRSKNAFVSTDVGRQIVDKLSDFFEFMNSNYTAEMEEKLDKVASGELSYVEMMREFYDPFKLELKQAYMSDHVDYGYRCNQCGNDTPMYLHHGKFGYYLACINYPNSCKNTLSCKVINERPVLKPSRGDLIEDSECPICGSLMVKIDGQFGPYYGCSEYPICKGKRKAPYGKKCPKCGDELYATLYHGEGTLFCMGYHKHGCDYSESLPKGEIADPKDMAKEGVPKKIRKYLKK